MFFNDFFKALERESELGLSLQKRHYYYYLLLSLLRNKGKQKIKGGKKEKNPNPSFGFWCCFASKPLFCCLFAYNLLGIVLCGQMKADMLHISGWNQGVSHFWWVVWALLCGSLYSDLKFRVYVKWDFSQLEVFGGGVVCMLFMHLGFVFCWWNSFFSVVSVKDSLCYVRFFEGWFEGIYDTEEEVKEK